MVNYILSRRKRRPGTRTLTGAITYEPIRGMAEIGFRIGNLNILQSKAPYWYVLNYGKKVSGERFIPGGGKYRPVMFGNSPADPSLKGHGTQRATIFRKITGNESIPTAIRPINYISATIFKLGAEWRRILPKSVMPGQLRGTMGAGGAMGGGVWRT